jgi:heme-degrading monooxygenase HmoA
VAHVRVAIYQIMPGTADEILRRAQTGMLPIFRQQPGFIAYEGVVTVDDEVVSISTWESAEQAQAAVHTATGWVRENLADMILSVDNYVGEVGFSTRYQ